MSTATATDATAPKKGGKKKLIIILAAVLVLVLGGGGAAFVLLKKPAASEADGEGDEAELADEERPAKSGKVKHDPKAAPTFVPLDTFTVNLADRDVDRFAQIGITLEISDPATAEQLKLFMPAIRDRILMAIADRTAAELLGREGKLQLAERLRRETSSVLGVDVPEPPKEGEVEDAKAERRRLAAERAMPVSAVRFSNFIVQ